MHSIRNLKSVTAAPPAIAVLSAVALFLGACSGGGKDTASPTQTATAAPSETQASSPPPAVGTATPTPGNAVTPSTAEIGEARAKLEEGRYEEAASDFDRIATAQPSARAEALLGAGIAFGRAGDPLAAVERLRGAAGEAVPGSALAGQAAYLLGLRLNDAGDFAGAVDALKAAAESGQSGALQPFIDAQYARAVGGAGDRAAAEALWATLVAKPGTPPSVRETALRERLALARAADDSAAELDLLVAIVNVTGGPADRAALAEAALAAGDSATFVAQLTSVVANFPGSRQAPLAIARLAEEGAGVDPGQEGLVRYRHGQLDATVAVLEPAVQQAGLTAFDASFRWFYLGAAYEDLGRLEDAVAAYDAATAAGAGGTYAHRAAYWAARVTEALDRPADASARYAALVSGGPDGEFTSESAFRAGYTLLAAGDPQGAIATWEGLGVPPQARLLYWQGRALEDVGDADGARSSYGAAIDAGPLDFYATEARIRLGQGGSPNVDYQPVDAGGPPDWGAIGAWVAAKAGPGTLDAAATAAPELAALGLVDAADTEVLATVVDGDAWSTARAMRAAHEAGLASTAAGLAVQLRQAMGAASHEVPPALLRVAYPLRYVATVDRVARTNNIDPLYLAALVRTESYWDADAGSHAGALGLTQVIPVTGEAIAQSMGYDGFDPEHLFRPSVSLAFGADYIGGQLRKFGSPYYALAAYNAGPVAAARWVDRVQGQPMADFVEAVEYNETRNYVVIAMENYAHYLRAWRGE
ncbi:MAG: lytic transglycosylase domain-containing protein [Dehalococcoidia bacterium]|nr:lytic transglycosylase domain-containing protein [Dehalococcoidia bacterium]